jgi:glycosyltransferase involved in cell wall biosynthesis
MGADFMISVVPAPIRDRMSDAFPSEPVTAGLEIEAAGRILDTAAMQLEVDILAPARPGSDASEPIKEYQRSTTSDRAGVGLASKRPARLSPGGVVYTTVLNPNDGRTNSRDIVTAFCWALRDMADATLVLKVCNSGLPAFYSALIPILYRLSPFKCRVLVLPGFLADFDYDKLIRATTYYVNASTSEGLCTPLMEFMSCGKPAIAPTHTAMADYIDPDVAFVLRASPQLATWPEDPRQVFRTISFRLDWESLLQAYQQSYRLAKVTPGDYCEMSKQARDRMQCYASPGIVSEELSRLFSSLAASTADRSHSPDPTSEDFTGRR